MLLEAPAPPAARTERRPLAVRSPATRPTLALLVFVALLGLVYTFASPYGAPPDEPTQYVKALATGNGDLLGTAVPYERNFDTPADRQVTYIRSTTRRFRLPDRVTAPAEDPSLCFILKPDQSAACPPGPTTLQSGETYVGVYPPQPYLLPGLAARLATNPATGITLARLANGLTCLVLVLLAAAALRDRAAPALSLLGLAVVVSPSLLYLNWGLNPNGTEIVASVAFVATLLRLTRDEAPPPWAWWGAGAAGFILATSRPVAPVWVAYGLLVALLLLGPRRSLATLRAGGHHAAIFGVAVAVGFVFTVAWDLAMGSGLQPDYMRRRDLVVPALQLLREFVQQHIALLGWGEVRMQQPLYDAWLLTLAALAAVALIVGTWRQRVACLVMAVAFPAMAVFFFMLTHPSGFPMGGRYIQAGMTALPLLWVEIVFRNRHKLSRRLSYLVVAGVILLVAVTHLDALFLNGRRYAVGVNGPASYLWQGSEWTPPAGWLPWVLCAVVGTSVLVAGYCRPAARS